MLSRPQLFFNVFIFSDYKSNTFPLGGNAIIIQKKLKKHYNYISAYEVKASYNPTPIDFGI